MRLWMLWMLTIFATMLGCGAAQQKSITELKGSEQFELGTKNLILTDSSRIDNYYGGSRIVNIKIWYPIDTMNASSKYPRSPYFDHLDQVVLNLEGWSQNDSDFFSNIQTKSIVGAPIKRSDKKYPLIIFSPSLGGNLNYFTFYAEKLAAKGFVVVGVNHLYESEFVIDDNAIVHPNNESFHDSLKLLNIPDQITADEYRAVKGMRQKVLGMDLVFVIDQMIQKNKSMFEDQIDVQKIGVWGHSIGGAAAVYAGVLDKRIGAVLNIDGTPPTLNEHEFLSVPFMFLEDLTDYHNHNGYMKQYVRRNEFCAHVKANAWRVMIGEISHNSFLDTNIHQSETDNDRTQVLDLLTRSSDYLCDFFEYALNGKSYNLSEYSSDQLEIKVF